MALDIKNRLGESVVALASVSAGKPVVVVAASDLARTKGVKAGALVKIASGVLGGGGGGKDDFAQGGGTNVAEIPNALSAIEKALSN
jgi:alanyl-tRNA synthetase